MAKGRNEIKPAPEAEKRGELPADPTADKSAGAIPGNDPTVEALTLRVEQLAAENDGLKQELARATNDYVAVMEASGKKGEEIKSLKAALENHEALAKKNAAKWHADRETLLAELRKHRAAEAAKQTTPAPTGPDKPPGPTRKARV